MSQLFNFYTIAAFILGVFLSGIVMNLVSGLKSKVAGG